MAIQPVIGALPQETEAYNLVSSLIMFLPALTTLGSLLDLGLFYFYNKKGHPWSSILAEEKLEEKSESRLTTVLGP